MAPQPAWRRPGWVTSVRSGPCVSASGLLPLWSARMPGTGPVVALGGRFLFFTVLLFCPGLVWFGWSSLHRCLSAQPRTRPHCCLRDMQESGAARLAFQPALDGIFFLAHFLLSVFFFSFDFLCSFDRHPLIPISRLWSLCAAFVPWEEEVDQLALHD